jgi:hypothetical protein
MMNPIRISERRRARSPRKPSLRVTRLLTAAVAATGAYVALAGPASAATATAARFGGMQVKLVATETGVQYYRLKAPDNGPTPQAVRVVRPTHPAPGMRHNFLFVLPVESSLGTTFGDPIKLLQSLDAEDRYNLTIVEPTFYEDPWYANVPGHPSFQYASFMTKELAPWVKATLSTTGKEQSWLLGFSKSGLGAQDLLLNNPSIFTLAASWDFPADMSSYGEYGAGIDFGTNANFTSHYELSQSFLQAHRGPFLKRNRIWIGGYRVFRKDITDYDALMTSLGIKHTTGPLKRARHYWDRSWVVQALAALSKDSKRF